MVRSLFLSVGVIAVAACSSPDSPDRPLGTDSDCSAESSALATRWGTGKPLAESEVATLLSEWQSLYEACPDDFNTANGFAYLLLTYGDTTRYREVATDWERRYPYLPLDGPSPARWNPPLQADPKRQRFRFRQPSAYSPLCSTVAPSAWGG